MAFTYGFYNYDKNDSGDSKLYDAEQMSQLFDGIITNGVYAHVGDKFNVTASNNKAKVGTGRAWFNHTWNYNDSALTLETPAKPTSNPRIDAVVIEINANRNSRTNTIKWVIGTEAASPARPAMTHSSDGLLNQYALAYVRRAPNDNNVITNNMITNAVGTSGTPYVTGVLQTVDASQILASFENQFEGFLNAKESDFETFITNHDASFQQFIDSEDRAFNEYIASKDLDFQDYIAGKTSEFNSVLQSYRNDYDSFRNDCERTFDSFMGNSQSQFGTFMTQSSTDFDNFISGLDDRFESFMSGLEPRCNEYIRRYALVAEGWATGNQNGTPTSIMPYFHNNAKYHSQQAAASAEAATTKANEASTSATSALNSANTATAKASEASNSASTATSKASAASTSATNAANSVKLAESYAKGGTGTRTGEDTDSALYYKNLAKTYAENAEAVTGIEIATTSRAGIVKPDGETIFVDTGGKITFGISDTDWAVLDSLF